MRLGWLLLLCAGPVHLVACGSDREGAPPSVPPPAAAPVPASQTPPAAAAAAPPVDLLHREGAILRVLDAPPFDPPDAILDGDPATTWRSDLDRPGGLGTTVTLEVPEAATVVAIEIAVARAPGGPESERIELVRGQTSLGVLEVGTAPTAAPARFEVGARGGGFALRLAERTGRLHVRELRALGTLPGAVEARAAIQLGARDAPRGDPELVQLARRDLRASVRALTRALGRARAPSDAELLAQIHGVGWRALALVELQLGHACTSCRVSSSAGLSQRFMEDALARGCAEALGRSGVRREAVRALLATSDVASAAELLDTLVDPQEPVAVVDGLDAPCASSPALIGEELLLSDAILDALDRWQVSGEPPTATPGAEEAATAPTDPVAAEPRASEDDLGDP
jgi:hypothetical protein